MSGSLCLLIGEDLKAVSSCEQAPLGALLQVRGDDNVAVFAMRCEMTVSSTPRPCLLILTGGDRGAIVEGGAVLGPALDVSALFSLALKDPFPVQFAANHYELSGIVCESGAGSGRLFVRGRLKSKTRANVWLRDPVQNTRAGTVVTDKPDDMLDFGCH
jgi:hypothetical protein